MWPFVCKYVRCVHDSILFIVDYVLYITNAAVLDGHAGIASAEYLREHLFDSIKNVLTEYSFGESCSAEGKFRD